MLASSCLILSILLVAGACAAWAGFRRLPYKVRPSLNLTKCLLVGTFLAGMAVHFPLYYQSFLGENLPALKSLIASAHHTLRLFILDGELDPIRNFALTLEGGLQPAYELWSMALYLLAPILTFSAVLSLLQNVSAYRRLLVHQFSQTYIFSELNEQSLALASSLKGNHPRALLIFTDVYETDSEEVTELCGRARELNALLFQCDIAALNLRWHRSNKITFFAIGEEAENIQQALSLIQQYGDDKTMKLYVFSSGIEGELLFQSSREGGMSVRRVNIVRSLINHTLYEKGEALFQHAVPGENGEKIISAVVLGMGQYGTEMVKALCWCCQMDGYEITIHAFDESGNAGEHFAAQCPELVSMSGCQQDGEARYQLHIHDGFDMDGAELERELMKLPHITHVFVSLGDETRNIRTGVRLREICERRKEKSTIQVVLHDSRKVESLRGIHDYRGTPYNLDFVGERSVCFSEQVVLCSELEKAALERHLLWGKEMDFWAFEYNYQSSVASAIHQQLRKLCGMPGADKPPKERTPEETLALTKLEHRRWNAFMRGEGYRYSGSRDKASRNTLAKVHHDLVPFDLLSEADKRKDDI